MYFAEKDKGPSMKDKIYRMGMWEKKKYCRFSKCICTTHSLLPSSVNSAFLQCSVRVDLGYYWHIIWEWEDGGGKNQRWVGSFLLNLEPDWGNGEAMKRIN